MTHECAKKLDKNASMVFGQNSEISISGKQDTIGKGLSRGAEWCKFHLPMRSYERTKKLVVSRVFRLNLKNLIPARQDTIGKGTSKGAD